MDCSDRFNPSVENCDEGLVYLHPTGCVSPQFAPCAGIDVPENETGIDEYLYSCSSFCSKLLV